MLVACIPATVAICLASRATPSNHCKGVACETYNIVVLYILYRRNSTIFDSTHFCLPIKTYCKLLYRITEGLSLASQTLCRDCAYAYSHEMQPNTCKYERWI